MADPSTTQGSSGGVLSFGQFFTQLKPILSTPQFFWYLGHVLTIISGVLYTFFSFFSYNASKKYYDNALLSIIITYFIVLFQVFRSSKLSLFNPKNFTNNDNFQYLSLAVVWYLISNTKIISGGLYPFLIFSLFHSLNYFKNYILPIFPSLSSTMRNQLSAQINGFITTYNEHSLVAAANLEVIILGQLLLGSLWILIQIFSNFRLALVNVFVLVHYIAFIKLRYRQSKHTKMLIDGYSYKADAFVNSGRVPPSLVGQYHQIKATAIRLLHLFPF